MFESRAPWARCLIVALARTPGRHCPRLATRLASPSSGADQRRSIVTRNPFLGRVVGATHGVTCWPGTSGEPKLLYDGGKQQDGLHRGETAPMHWRGPR